MNTEETNPIRSNLLLWLLTGRSNDFVSPLLNAGVTYATNNDDGSITNLRAELKLHLNSTDFFVLPALAATLLVVPPTFTLPQASLSAFKAGGAELDYPEVSVPLLASSANGKPFVDPRKAGSRGISSVSIRQLDGDEVSITDDLGVVYYTTSETFSEDGYLRLRVSGISDIGVEADFRVASWGAGSVINIALAPQNYPFARFAESVINNATFVDALSNEGLLEGFLNSRNSREKIGYAGLTIVRKAVRELVGTQLGTKPSGVVPNTAEELAWVAATLGVDCSVDSPGGFNA